MTAATAVVYPMTKLLMKRAMGNSAPRAASAIAKGAKLPNVVLDKGFPPKKVPLTEIIGGKKVVMVGLPGAFTPT